MQRLQEAPLPSPLQSHPSADVGPREESLLPSQQGACLLGLGAGCGHRWWSHLEPPLTGQEVTDRPQPPSLCLWDQPFLGEP